MWEMRLWRGQSPLLYAILLVVCRSIKQLFLLLLYLVDENKFDMIIHEQYREEAQLFNYRDLTPPGGHIAIAQPIQAWIISHAKTPDISCLILDDREATTQWTVGLWCRLCEQQLVQKLVRISIRVRTKRSFNGVFLFFSVQTQFERKKNRSMAIVPKEKNRTKKGRQDSTVCPPASNVDRFGRKRFPFQSKSLQKRKNRPSACVCLWHTNKKIPIRKKKRDYLQPI